jgi:hypothetical protein
VEIVQRFDSIWVVAFRYLKSVIWMFLVVIVLVVIGTYFLFRQLQLTTKLETEQGILRERVRDATIELQKRNQLLPATCVAGRRDQARRRITSDTSRCAHSGGDQ